MSDEYGLQGLNGNEIVADILAQLKKRLEGDCNLRSNDSYSRGYSAKITYSVLCFGLDQQNVSGEFASGNDLDEAADEGADGELEIEQDENVEKVRDRIEKAKREGEESSPDVDDDDAPEPSNATDVRAKRKYTRKVQQLVSPGVIGGAEDFKE